jgi:hypothetical protein
MEMFEAFARAEVGSVRSDGPQGENVRLEAIGAA